MRSKAVSEEIKSIIADRSYPLASEQDLDPLMERIGDARIVMLGEASHGTHEYYVWRSMISRRLIKEKNFSFIAVEGDWPDCYLLNRFVKNYKDGGTKAVDVLHGFNRWPTWMWANWEIVALAEWLSKHNHGKLPMQKTGFYGLDVYSLWESLEALEQYLSKKDPAAWEIAKKALKCFEPYEDGEGQAYARAANLVPTSCKDEVVDLWKTIRTRSVNYNTDHEAVLSAQQNARVAVQAESYYSKMSEGGAVTWNLRDRHMMDTLNHLMEFHGPQTKAIVWAHNTHIGDASATDMRRQGMYNIGELARQEYGNDDVVLVGFGSHRGTVMAASHWSGQMKAMNLPEAEEGSWEDIMHRMQTPDRLLITGDRLVREVLDYNIGHRAVGVVYDPEFERYGNYVPTNIPNRYDAFIHIDETHALHPLHLMPDGHKMPETFPWGV